MPRPAARIAATALLLLLAGCGSQPVHHAAAVRHGWPPIVEPAIPKVPKVAVRATRLTPSMVAQDDARLAALFAAHPGDGIVRGPAELVFDIDLSLDPEAHAFGAHLTVHMMNNTGAPIPVLYFNAWPDAYHYRICGGYERIRDVTVDGRTVRFTLRGTLLRVYPATPVAVGQAVEVGMNLQALLPHIPDRYGWTGRQMALGNWFPMPAVHDQYGWVTPPYYSEGESFYSLTAAFHLHITAPAGYVYAATGDPGRPHAHPDGTVTRTYTAIGVRDVAVLGDTRYEEVRGTVDGVRVGAYAEPRNHLTAVRMERIALSALRYYDRLYGRYPFAQLSLCLMQADFDGMEYPELDMVVAHPGFAGSTGTLATEVTVSHELAHQWFFSLVGDDEYLTPFMDEAFATFSSYRFVRLPQPWWQDSAVLEDASDPVSAFPDPDFSIAPSSDYDYAVYVNGSYALLQIKHVVDDAVGPGAFDAMMRAYVQRYAYRVATVQDFLDTVSGLVDSHVPTVNMTAEFASLSIYPSDDLHSPVNVWARLEERENGRSWH